MIEKNSPLYNLITSASASQTCTLPKHTSAAMSGVASVTDASAAVAAQAAAATGTYT